MSTSFASAALDAGLLAQTAEEPSAGPIGLLIIVVLFIVTVLLIRNMTGRLNRLPKSFPDPVDEAEDRTSEPPV